MEQFLRVNITGDASKLQRSLKGASNSLKSFGSKLTSIGTNLSLRVTAPLGLAGGAAIKMASDFQESLNKVDVAFKGSSKQVRDFSKTTLREFGIARGTALDMAALFGDMATSMGLTTGEAANMSTSLVGLAGDLASFKNMNIEEVTTALNGVFTGETESLKRLGIVMTEVNLKQFAMEQGIKKNIKEMTQAEKVALRFQYVLSTTGNAQGDFARTSGGAANQMRIFQESLKELGANFGNLILPLFTDAVKKANGLITAFTSMSRESKVLALQIAGVAAALPLIITAVGALSTAFAFLITPVGLTVAALAGLIYFFDDIYNGIIDLKNALKLHLYPSLIKLDEFFRKYVFLPLKTAVILFKKFKDEGLGADFSSVLDDAFKEGEQISKESGEKISKLYLDAFEETTKKKKKNIIKDFVQDLIGKIPILGDIGKGGGGGDTSSAAPDFSGFQADTSALEVKPKVLNSWKSLNAAIDASREKMQGVERERQKMKEEHDALKSQIQGELAPAFGELGSAIKTNLKLGDSVLGKFASSMIDLAMGVISSALAASTAAAIQGAAQGSLLSGPAAPFVIGGLIAAAVGTVASAFSSNVPALASGVLLQLQL